MSVMVVMVVVVCEWRQTNRQQTTRTDIIWVSGRRTGGIGLGSRTLVGS